MRRIFLLSAALFLLVGACWDGPAATTGGGTGGVASVCDGTNACDTCTSCALNGPCATLYSACLGDSSCSAIDQCAGPCGADATCKQNCLALAPAGADAYNAVTSCVDCTECPKSCPGLRACP